MNWQGIVGPLIGIAGWLSSACSRKRKYWAVDAAHSASTPEPGTSLRTMTRRSAWGKAKGSMRIRWTVAYRATVAPMPRPRTSTATAVKPGLRARPREAWRQSINQRRSIVVPPEDG